jgi:hypothetical protein
MANAVAGMNRQQPLTISLCGLFIIKFAKPESDRAGL